MAEKKYGMHIGMLWFFTIILMIFIQFIPIATGQYERPYEEDPYQQGELEGMVILFYTLCCGLLLLIIGVAYWVYKDAELKGCDGTFWGLLTFFTFIIGVPIGLLIWLIVRRKYLFGYRKSYRRRQQQKYDQAQKQSYQQPFTLLSQEKTGPSTQALDLTLKPELGQHHQIDYPRMSKDQLMEECRQRGIKVGKWTSDKKKLMKLIAEHDALKSKQIPSQQAQYPSPSTQPSYQQSLPTTQSPPPAFPSYHQQSQQPTQLPPQGQALIPQPQSTQSPQYPTPPYSPPQPQPETQQQQYHQQKPSQQYSPQLQVPSQGIPTQPDGTWFCPTCGTKLEPAFVFCTNCGFRR